jgi:hypothetical protein
MIVRLAQIVLLILGFLFVVSQIVIPLLKNTRLFPLFTSVRKNKLQDEITETNELLEEQELKEYLEQLRKQLQPEEVSETTTVEAPAETTTPKE